VETGADVRIRRVNEAGPDPGGAFVLYWMIAYRRGAFNFALQRAVHWAQELGKPLVVLEALRCGYRWASDRLHRFILEGMADNARHFAGHPVTYYPYVEPRHDADKGLLEALAAKACLIVTDDFPAFFLPRMVAAASQKLAVRLEQVDSNGLLPMGVPDRVFPTAYAFRRFLQKALPEHLLDLPAPDPLEGVGLKRLKALPRSITEKWPTAFPGKDRVRVCELPIDHTVGPGAEKGGGVEGRRKLRRFLDGGLSHYTEKRNEPEQGATSGLSAYLHFGHLSAHEVWHGIALKENWSVHDLSERTAGSRSGWWGMSPPAEAFLDQLVTWRELGVNFCSRRQDYDRYESLPAWALETLSRHETDERVPCYDLEELEGARTHDPLWNAAQTQLVREGRIHNYLRMLWGKKILQWSPTPRAALEAMLTLNDKYALDGRDPNSYSGIFWILGRYDRPWGPERPIFGKVRYMSSRNTARKVRVGDYIKKYGG